MTKARDATRSRDMKVIAEMKRLHLPGSPCPRCGQPMWDVSTLDGSHAEGEELVYGGGQPPSRLEHSRCNRSHGGRLSRARQAGRYRVATTVLPTVEPLGTTQFW